MADFVEAYRLLEDGGGLDAHRFLQDGLRRYLLDHKTAGRELAVLLTQMDASMPAGEERIDAALRVLFDALEILRVELERGRSGARQRMLRWQTALARHVFREDGDGDLCAAVSHVLLQSRIELLPVLLDAHSERMMAAQDELAMDELSEEQLMAGLYGSLEELGLDSPFEMLQAFQQLVGVAPAELQLALCGELLKADNPLIRDMAALMLFHQRPEVREGAARQLAELPGERITPDTLRRLIVARNWFPETVRRSVDRAVANARRARVACAPLPDSPAMTVFATVVDGAGAQSFQVMVPDGRGFVSCSILLKQGVGVADAFELPFATKRELKDFQAMLKQEVQACRTSIDYLELRVCQALAEGAWLGNVPDPWLVAIAERLGRDQWRAIPGDPRQELAALREELEEAESPFLTSRRLRKALQDSADWPARKHFASSWFEDDATVDRTVEKALGKGKRGFDERKVVSALIEQVLEPRREIWLERLVLTTLWLKACTRPPLAWQQMFHVAEQLADPDVPLADIPLMQTVAEGSFGACVARLEERA
jgi:hypothetical protein